MFLSSTLDELSSAGDKKPGTESDANANSEVGLKPIDFSARCAANPAKRSLDSLSTLLQQRQKRANQGEEQADKPVPSEIVDQSESAATEDLASKQKQTDFELRAVTEQERARGANKNGHERYEMAAEQAATATKNGGSLFGGLGASQQAGLLAMHSNSDFLRQIQAMAAASGAPGGAAGVLNSLAAGFPGLNLPAALRLDDGEKDEGVSPPSSPVSETASNRENVTAATVPDKGNFSNISIVPQYYTNVVMGCWVYV